MASRPGSLLRGVALFALVGLASRAALGQPSDGISLEFQAPRGCGSKREVLEKFSQAWGEAEVPRVSARVSVRPDGDLYVLSYEAELAGARSSRTLSVENCEAATEAAALLLLLTADPLLAESLGAEGPLGEGDGGSPLGRTQAGQESETGSEEEDSSSEGKAPARRTRERRRHRRPRQGVRGQLALTAGTSAGLAPSWTVGPGIDASLRIGRIAGGLAAGYHFGPKVEASAAPGVQLASQLGTAELWMGPSLGRGRLVVEPYVGVAVQLLRIDAQGAAMGTPGTSPYWTFAAGCRGLLLLEGRLGVFAKAGLQVPFDKPHFMLLGLQDPVFVPDSVALELALGVFWKFGSQN